jgi:putative FmdB family regulatory protein
LPNYEYGCKECNIIFEELLMSREEVAKYAKEHPCPECRRPAPRVISRANFQFKVVAEGDPTRRGNSGVHDLDYPVLDKAVGRSANRKWKEYNARKEARDRARRELGTNAVSQGPDGRVSATDGKTLDARTMGIRTWQKALDQNSD